MNPLFIIAAVLAGFVVAIVLMRRGWTGRVVDHHPTCRACGFDLFNRPQDQTACPECGGDVSTPRGIRVGNRQRRRGLFYVGLSLLLVTLLVGVFTGVRMARSVDWYQQMPDAWVDRDTRATSISQQTLAWKELKRRFLKNSLSRKHTLRLVDATLMRQADAKSTWINEMGDFVEAVHKAKALPGD